MRKLLSLSLCLLAYAFCVDAQQTHWSYEAGQYKNETFVYADVTVYTETVTGMNEQPLTTLQDYNAYEYAAFIDGELRGVASIVENTNGETVTYLLQFRVEGDENDMGMEIMFKAYDRNVNKEFDLYPSTEQPFFTGETIEPGIPSNPLHLQIVYPMEDVPVNSITTPFYGWSSDTGAFSFIECNKGDDLTPYFTDGQAFSILPADASNKSVTFSLYEGNQSLAIDNSGAITVTGTGAGIIQVTSVDNPQVSCLVYVLAYNDFKTVSVTESEVTVSYKNQPVDISEQVMGVVVFGPDGCETIGGEMVIESSAADVVEINNQGAFAYKPGEAVLTFKLPVVDHLMKTFNPNGNHTTYVTATLRVIVVQAVTGLQVVWPATIATEQYSDVIVKPLPEGAQFNKKALFSITGYYMNYNGVTVDNTACYYDDGPKQGIGWVYGEIPGDLVLTVTYDDGEGTVLTEDSEVIECGYTFGMSEGWTWRSIPYANFKALNSIEDIFGTELIEIRTQESQIYNDPLYGYFGDKNLLNQNMGFKLKMGELPVPPSLENINYLKSYVFYGGSLGMQDGLALRKGWNYLPNPFVTSQALADIFYSNTAFVEGDRIVSKEDGFAEYANGQWTGNLTSLQPGQGYLFYNAGDANRTIIFTEEFHAPSSRQLVSRRAPRTRTWNYDASRFRDNMTIVAKMENAPLGGQYTVGAFVGDECRGEGEAVDGYLFITVHANSGELINFKLYNYTTGQVFDIAQNVHMQQMLGSVRQPFSLTASDNATGIDNLIISGFRPDSRCYDLQGRPADNRQPVNSQLRIVDGKKVVK